MFLDNKYSTVYFKIINHRIEFLKKEEFDDEIHIKGLPEQRGGFKNRYFINNGIEDRLIPIDQEVPLSWTKGRLWEAPLSQLKEASAKRHTPEKDIEHGEKLRNRIRIKKSGKSKSIKIEDLETYRKEGWMSYSYQINGKVYPNIQEYSKFTNISNQEINRRCNSQSDNWKHWTKFLT